VIGIEMKRSPDIGQSPNNFSEILSDLELNNRVRRIDFEGAGIGESRMNQKAESKWVKQCRRAKFRARHCTRTKVHHPL